MNTHRILPLLQRVLIQLGVTAVIGSIALISAIVSVIVLILGSAEQGEIVVAMINGETTLKRFYKRNGKIVLHPENKTMKDISGLEAYAIAKAHDAKRYKVENSVNPKYEIDEYDLPLIEEVYEEIQFIMATQGYKVDNSKSTLDEANILHTTRNGILAFGVYNSENFGVLEDSEIDMSRKCHSTTIEKQRQTALANGNIVCVDGKYKLTVSVSFASPSSAAMFVLGGR